MRRPRVAVRSRPPGRRRARPVDHVAWSSALTSPSERPLSDRRRLYAASALRGAASAATGVAIGAYLKRLGHGPRTVGIVTSAGLAGGAVAMLLATLFADRLGRRRSLVVLSVVGVVGGSLVLLPVPVPLLVALSFLGMWNGMGRDRGAASVLEAAMLPSTTTDATRTTAFARYNAVQDAGNALGFLLVAALLAAPLPTSVSESAEPWALRAVLGVYPLLGLVAVVLYAGLSGLVEVPAGPRRSPLSPAGRRTIARLSALFALDSVGGGFVSASLVSYFLFERFGARVEAVAVLFFAARVLNALSHLAAGWLARRIGLVRTMVLTHIPSSLLLATVSVAPSFGVAAVLFLLRESLAEMDVPTRQSYVMAVVEPHERTAASGATSLVRLAGWAVAPAVAGALMQGVSLALPLVVAAALKIAYDVLLWISFRRVRPREERGDAGPRPTSRST